MEDTSPEIKSIFRGILMSRSEAERFLMCAEMFDTARCLALTSMPKDLSAADQKRYIYERTYSEPLPEDFFSRK